MGILKQFLTIPESRTAGWENDGHLYESRACRRFPIGGFLFSRCTEDGSVPYAGRISVMWRSTQYVRRTFKTVFRLQE